jgi:hypothetical protein
MKKFLHKYALKIAWLFMMIALVWGWSNVIGLQRSKNIVFWYGWGWGSFWWGGGWYVPFTTVWLLDTGWPASTGTVSTGTETPKTPRWDAYTFAKDHGISTMPSYEKARLNDGISRGEAAKVVTQYYKNILKKTITRTDICNPKNYKDYDKMDTETAWYVRDVCSIWIMGWKNNKSSTIEYFKSNSGISRAEIAAILSRMIYNTASANQWEQRYTAHIKVLNDNGILPNDKSPESNEVRWDVFEMLQRTSK